MRTRSLTQSSPNSGSEGGASQSVTGYSDACKNFICLVPRCDDRIVSRCRARDHVESSVAADCTAGDAVLADNLASGSNPC